MSAIEAAVAGGLVALVGPANALLVDAASFALAGAVLWWATRGIPTPKRQVPEVGEATSSYLGELRDGWNFMRKDQVLMGIGVMVAITNLLDQAWSSVLVPVWARDSGYGVAAVARNGLLADLLGTVSAWLDPGPAPGASEAILAGHEEILAAIAAGDAEAAGAATERHLGVGTP